MFDVNKMKITMFEGDFGEKLPFKITSGEVLEGDVLRFIIKGDYERIIINKEMEVVENSFNFSLTKDETSKLKAGEYEWSLKQYRDDLLIDTLTANNVFKVERG